MPTVIYQGSGIAEFMISKEKEAITSNGHADISLLPSFQANNDRTEWLADFVIEIRGFKKDRSMYLKHQALHVLSYKPQSYSLPDNLSNRNFIILITELFQKSFKEINDQLFMYTGGTVFADYVANYPNGKIYKMLKQRFGLGASKDILAIGAFSQPSGDNN